jgi:hypothetical protein
MRISTNNMLVQVRIVRGYDARPIAARESHAA